MVQDICKLSTVSTVRNSLEVALFHLQTVGSLRLLPLYNAYYNLVLQSHFCLFLGIYGM